MCKVLRVTITAAVGMALPSCTAPPVQGNGAAMSFGIAEFDIEAILGSVLAPAEAYLLPPPPAVIPRRTRKSYSDHSYARSKAPSPVAAYGARSGAKQSTPATIHTGNVAQELEARFKSAQAKATKAAWKTSLKRTSTASAPHSSRSSGGTKSRRSFLVPLTASRPLAGDSPAVRNYCGHFPLRGKV